MKELWSFLGIANDLLCSKPIRKAAPDERTDKKLSYKFRDTDPLCAQYRKSDLCTPRHETLWPRSQIPHSCHVSVSDLYIPRIGQPTWAAAEYTDRSWEYLKR
jgi:hypothetical protein